MPTSGAAHLNFQPQVANGHIQAHFDRKMGLGQLAIVDKTLTGAPGDTVTFPYWKAIGAAQKPTESEGLEVEPLQDDKFQVTVQEAGKAVGWKDSARRKGGAAKGDWQAEGERQMGRVLAEQVDADYIELIGTNGNYETGFTASTADHKMTIGTMLDLKIGAFGDKQDQAIAIAMHSLCFATLMKDSSAGFLKADATMPLYGAPGFQGMYLGQALFVLDTMPRVADVAGKKAYAAYSFKPNAFGLYLAEELNVEADRDILTRENIMACTMWYGVLTLHGKVNAADKRIARGTFATEVSA